MSDAVTGDEILYLYDKYAIREYNMTTGLVTSLSGNTNPTEDMSDSDGNLHQAGVIPASDYFMGFGVLPDGLYFHSKQGIRKLIY
jgi:hypothetical protein